MEEKKVFTNLEKQRNLSDMLPNSVLDYIHKKMTDDKESEQEAHNKEEWQQIARVTDRFFMMLQIIANLIMLVVFLIRMTSE